MFDRRLVGVWRSDLGRTRKEIEARRDIPPKRRRLLLMEKAKRPSSRSPAIEWKSGPDGLIKALREKGLGFSLEVREVDVIVIRRP